MAQEGPQTAGLATNASNSNGAVEANVGFPAQTSISSNSVQLTIRLLMQSRDVGSIIGKAGATISKFRSESRAHINITDGGTERIVTLTGCPDAILNAFSMICKKVEEGFRQSSNASGQQPPVSLRLLVPASQCGPLIGKAGSKIKELREETGTTVQVAGELLPNSTERAVTIAGTSGNLVECFRRISIVILENPVRGATIPYRPRQQASVSTPSAANPFLGFPHTFTLNTDPFALGVQGPLVPLKPMGSEYAPMTTAGHANNTFNMVVPNELVGCVIGRGGHKISEIRRQSGASIKIANTVANCPERRITVSGSPDCVATAQQLIASRLQAEVANKPVVHTDLMSMAAAQMAVMGSSPNANINAANGHMHMLPKQDLHILPHLQSMPLHSATAMQLASPDNTVQSVQA